MDGDKPIKASDRQVAGSHYKSLAIQPFQFIHSNGIGFLAGNVIKYVCRYKQKGGIEDLKKAAHYIELLIEAETPQPGYTIKPAEEGG